MKNKKNSLAYRLFHRYFIVAMNGMALGLFSTLIIGLIINQIGQAIPGSLGSFLVSISPVAMALTGPVIGIGIATSLESPKLVTLSSGVVGFIGAFGAVFANGKIINSFGQLIIKGSGDPLGAFIAVVIAAEVGRLVSGKTKIDIIVTPLVTIITGSLIAVLLGPRLLYAMKSIGSFIQMATNLAPFTMGLVISVVMGMLLTLPISSAAISIILGLSGISAGASAVGCCSQMIGFAVITYHVNGLNGALANGLGTSMLQVPNILKKPVIWIPPIVSSAILGPVSSVVLKMTNNPAGAGMGTAGLVGPLMAWQSMAPNVSGAILPMEILAMHFVLPAIISLAVFKFMVSKKIVSPEDYKLSL